MLRSSKLDEVGEGKRMLIISLLSAFILILAPDTEASWTQADQAVDVSLGPDTAVPGGETYLPLALSTGGAKLDKLVSEISFPKKLLSFVEAKRGLAGELAEIEINAEVRENNKGSELAILKLMVSAKKEIRDGVLVNLKFKVSEDAKEGTIKLKSTSKLTTSGGEEITREKEGEVTISKSPVPIFGCFFYMH